jgi:hypothetical protein
LAYKRFSFTYDGTVGSGSGSVSSIGWQPDLVILVFCGGSFGNENRFSFGASDGSNQWVVADSARSFSSYSYRRHHWDDSSSYALYTTGALATYLSIDNFTSSDFDYSFVNPGSPPATVTVYGYAISHPTGDCAVGVGTQDDSSISAGFRPGFVFYASAQRASTGAGTGLYVSLGGGDESVQRVAWAGASTGGGNCRYDSGVIRWAESDGTTLRGIADHSFTATGADLSWSGSDAGGRLFGWFAIGSPSAPESICGSLFRPQFYRRL